MLNLQVKMFLKPKIQTVGKIKKNESIGRESKLHWVTLSRIASFKKESFSVTAIVITMV